VNYAKKLLAQIGLEPERLEMYFLSSAEGIRFAEIATEMTERARQLGPNPLRNGYRTTMEVEE
jgi:F420-non-reducing hydrogenase iron-sulfur subunit